MVTYNRATELGAALRVKPGPLEVDELLILLHPLRILRRIVAATNSVD